MTYNELLQAWRNGAKISYRHLRYLRYLPPYNAAKEEGLKTLFYNQGVKFAVHK